MQATNPGGLFKYGQFLLYLIFFNINPHTVCLPHCSPSIQANGHKHRPCCCDKCRDKKSPGTRETNLLNARQSLHAYHGCLCHFRSTLSPPTAPENGEQTNTEQTYFCVGGEVQVWGLHKRALVNWRCYSNTKYSNCFSPKLCLLSRFPRLKTLLTIYDTMLYFQQTDGKLRSGKGIVWPQATVDTHTAPLCVELYRSS